MTQTTQPEFQTAPASPAESQLAALLHGTGFAPLNDIGWIRATGDDRVRWLNGMVTNSIQGLQPGQCNYNFFLSAQGRIQGDATVFAQDDSLLLQTESSQVPNLLTLLDRFIIMDDVELNDISATRHGILIAGPQASALLAQLHLHTADLAPLHFKTSTWHDAHISLLHPHSPLVPRFELWADPGTIAELSAALQQAGALQCDPLSLDWLRLLEGTPRYGTDIHDKVLPQETAQTRALHFSKGCYLGQEIVERIRSRGNVHRTFTTFRLEGALPAPGTFLEVDARQIGELTSSAAIPLQSGAIQLALGYIRREALELASARNATLTYPGGVAIPISSPVDISAAI